MSRLKRYIRLETDVEFFSCVHGVSMIFMYGFVNWFAGHSEVPFSLIVEMMILGYLSAWIQKGLFMKETAYSTAGNWIREISWCLIPYILMLIAGGLFGWFRQRPWGVPAAYYAVMLCYFVMVRIFVKFFYQEDTDEINRLIKKRRQSKKEDQV